MSPEGLQQPLQPTVPARDQGDAEYARIRAVCSCFGLSKSGVYRLAGEGRIRLVKLGGSTLVDIKSVREMLAALPSFKK